MDPDTLRLARPWRLRACGLLVLLALAGARPLRPPTPAAAPAAAPPPALLEATQERKVKTCNPPCKSPQVCAEGTCALPAAGHQEPHSEAQAVWLYESLR